ncbi:Uncharacterized protein FKW44_007231, partial [Caligus rogercresseyi]
MRSVLLTLCCLFALEAQGINPTRAMEVDSYEMDLSLLGFDDRAESLVVNGIWLLYEGVYYNRRNSDKDMLMTYVWGQDYCLEDLGDMGSKASSIRFAGGDDLGSSSLNIYEEEGFMGAELYVTQDEETIKYKEFGRSLILTGCEPDPMYAYTRILHHLHVLR